MNNIFRWLRCMLPWFTTEASHLQLKSLINTTAKKCQISDWILCISLQKMREFAFIKYEHLDYADHNSITLKVNYSSTPGPRCRIHFVLEWTAQSWCLTNSAGTRNLIAALRPNTNGSDRTCTNNPSREFRLFCCSLYHKPRRVCASGDILNYETLILSIA